MLMLKPAPRDGEQADDVDVATHSVARGGARLVFEGEVDRDPD
ncbi:hypothetical protein FHW73_001711 [Luteimonas sp. RC10]|nr:hypothetical protein [Luteimonas sp. RC10]